MAAPAPPTTTRARPLLERFFNMEVGKDYKVISFQGEPERIRGADQRRHPGRAGLGAARRAGGQHAGMKVLLRTGDYMPRAGGTFWSPKAFADENPETVKKFIRAIAKAVMYFRDNKAGSITALKEHLGIDNDRSSPV